jgi:hypothetical protein
MSTERILSVSLAWSLLGALIVFYVIIPRTYLDLKLMSLNDDQTFDYLSTRTK